jgi:hypothetical protein
MGTRHVYLDILDKINRANKHIDDLISFWATCGETHPNRTRIERDPQTGEGSVYVADLTPIPPEISLIAGDAFQNLRTALDHLACGMIKKNQGPVTTLSGFPIFDSDTKYFDPKDGAIKKVRGMDPTAIKAIDSLKPYKGGNDKLWILHKLNNIDKHRLLLTVGQVVAGSTLLPSDQAKMIAAYRVMHPTGPDPDLSGIYLNFIPDAFPPFPKVGDKLRTVPASEAYEDIKFSLDIAINEKGVTRGTLLYVLLHMISGEVKIIVNNLARFL